VYFSGQQDMSGQEAQQIKQTILQTINDKGELTPPKLLTVPNLHSM